LSLGALAAACLLLASCGEGENILAGAGPAPTDVEIKATDRVMGSPDAPVTMIEFASMTCPHCAAFSLTTLPQIKSAYIDTGQVKFIFREFPLDGLARIASSLARCQTGDNYFAFIDLIFANQQQWLDGFRTGRWEQTQESAEESLVEYARMAGMGREQAIACMRDPQNLAQVDENWEEAQNRYNINSTPGFVINGTTHSGAQSFEDFQAIFDALLEGN
jgi:protein-disulfide isomerase